MKERTHRQEIEAKKRDGYQTSYDEINKIDFDSALDDAIEIDPGLSNEQTVENLRRAVITLARRVRELEKEWS